MSSFLFDAGKFQPLDNEGNIIPNGSVEIYKDGVLATVYTDAELTTTQANPVILDNSGRATIFLDASYSYDIILKDAEGGIVWSMDNVDASLLGGGSGGLYVIDTIDGNLADLDTENSPVLALGYHTIGDGGGGLFYWNANDSSTADNGVVFGSNLITTGRWRRQYSGDVVKVDWFGTYNDGSHNDATEINRATQNYKNIEFSNKTYTVSEPIDLNNVKTIISNNATIAANFPSSDIADWGFDYNGSTKYGVMRTDPSITDLGITGTGSEGDTELTVSATGGVSQGDFISIDGRLYNVIGIVSLGSYKFYLDKPLESSVTDVAIYKIDFKEINIRGNLTIDLSHASMYSNFDVVAGLLLGNIYNSNIGNIKILGATLKAIEGIHWLNINGSLFAVGESKSTDQNSELLSVTSALNVDLLVNISTYGTAIKFSSGYYKVENITLKGSATKSKEGSTTTYLEEYIVDMYDCEGGCKFSGKISGAIKANALTYRGTIHPVGQRIFYLNNNCDFSGVLISTDKTVTITDTLPMYMYSNNNFSAAVIDLPNYTIDSGYTGSFLSACCYNNFSGTYFKKSFYSSPFPKLTIHNLNNVYQLNFYGYTIDNNIEMNGLWRVYTKDYMVSGNPLSLSVEITKAELGLPDADHWGVVLIQNYDSVNNSIIDKQEVIYDTSNEKFIIKITYSTNAADNPAANLKVGVYL